MPSICKDKFEKIKEGRHSDDDLHVEAISNPDLAAFVAALKYVKNSHLSDKLELLDVKQENDRSYLRTIINQKNRALWSVNHLEDRFFHNPFILLELSGSLVSDG